MYVKMPSTCMHAKSLQSYLFASLWSLACQASLSLGFSRHEYWSGLPCLLPGDLHNLGIKPMSPPFPALACGSLRLVSCLLHRGAQ